VLSFDESPACRVARVETVFLTEQRDDTDNSLNLQTVANEWQQQPLIPDDRAVIFSHGRKAERGLSTGHDLSVRPRTVDVIGWSCQAK
jgi:hypothetical protein